MWSIPKINSPTIAVKTIWNIINNTPGEEIEHMKLLKLLSRALPSISIELCEEYIATTIADSLLVKSVKSKTRARQKVTTVYTLPKWQEFAFIEEQPDFWCYECHTTGDISKCEGCTRSFHERCCKTDEEKQLELEQFVPKQKRITISSFGTVPRRQSTVSPDGSEESIPSAELPSPSINDASVSPNHEHATEPDEVAIIEEGTTFPAADATAVKHEDFSEENVKQEEDHKVPIAIDEPQFVCVVRPPDRRLEERLNASSVKPEDSDIVGSALQQEDGVDEVKRLCYACRLLKYSSNNAPPHVGKEELNYLLKFIIEQYKSWIPEDTYSLTKLGNGKVRQTPAWDRKTIELCKKMFLRQPKSIAYIREEITAVRYNTLDEFHVDLLDIVHNIAIIHGVTSLEYDAMMYFLADCVYDLFEIRQCPDCYRHSNEKNGPDFFARPCRTRHELVYAKQKSYQYWPAKVIRVVNNKYDVRFFGDKHLRALVDAQFVKPIDTELGSLKVNLKQRGFQLAMEELYRHLSLLDCSREVFAFGWTPPPAMASPMVSTVPATIPATFGMEPRTSARMVVAYRKKRRNQSKPYPAVPHIPSEKQTDVVHNDDVHYAPTTVSTKGRAAKRQITMPRTQPHKVSRNAESTTASNQTSLENNAVRIEIQQNNNTISSNYNGQPLGTTPVNSARLPRTKQNLKQMFAEQSSPNKLKAILDQTNDPQEMRQAALRALQESEERCQRKINWMKETHEKHISETKKKQWCAACEKESILACCWNTSYCTVDCQLKHWPSHKNHHQA